MQEEVVRVQSTCHVVTVLAGRFRQLGQLGPSLMRQPESTSSLTQSPCFLPFLLLLEWISLHPHACFAPASGVIDNSPGETEFGSAGEHPDKG
jgi:hypothetical protein